MAIKRSLLISLVVVVALALGIFGWQSSRAQPPGPNTYTISMYDYGFSPDSMAWRAGQTVTITLVNNTQSQPGKAHEIMFGQGERYATTVFGPQLREGFQRPLLPGTQFTVLAAQGVMMLMPGQAQPSGSNFGRLFMPMSMPGMSNTSMPGTPMPGTPMPGTPMPGTGNTPMPGTGNTPMPGTGNTPMPGTGNMPMPQMYMSRDMMGTQVTTEPPAVNQFMIMLMPHGSMTFRFTVPNRSGAWTYGCFQQSAEHYLNGMRGSVTITA